jgi:type IV pilus assembly protein PilY1
MKSRCNSTTWLGRHGALLALACSCASAWAQVSISNVPLSVQADAGVRPNLMFILDDSGSMGRNYMPDTANFANRCFGYHGLNRLAYNPSITYRPPLNADGSSFPNADANWPNVKNNGFDSGSATTDLSSAPISLTDENANFYYAQLASGQTAPTSCPSRSNTRNSTFTLVTSLPSAQRTNYANWWAYYRTRMLTMKSGTGRAFANIDASRFRVGYSTISETGYDSSSAGFLAVREFDATGQKSGFFSKLYGQSASGYTPLRPALEKAGRMYAGVNMAGSALPSGVDPVTHSCQRNYTLLSTDGYWNTDTESNFRSSYVPHRLDGSTIGNQDGGSTARPMLDDGRSQGGNWVTGGSGVSNTLADIAMYYYNTDLRTTNCTVGSENICINNITPAGNDTANHQHMTTYTLGLGVSGRVLFQPNYDSPTLTATSNVLDFVDIRNGSAPWPNPMDAEDERRIDDLWHAAVNGRGRYYSAADPETLTTGLTSALDQILSFNGNAAAAATSSLQPVPGDNFVYLATFTNQLWEGDIKAFTLDSATGAINRTLRWQARNTVAAQAGASADTRNIYIFNAAATNRLSNFTHTNLSPTQQAYFSNLCAAGDYRLSQCAGLDDARRAIANGGANVVNYLRGQSGYENDTANALASRVFRDRQTPLGDIINGAPVYVKGPPFKYTDAGYSSFKTTYAGRQGVVYVAANDGMLHAFNADTGAELWAYVPSMVLPDLFRLADANYASNHRYFVDGAPVVADIWNGTHWKTILVGGLNAGGRGYYALDVTNPTSPAALWEFSSANDSDLGLTFGNPVITKLKDGTWSVIFSSGYNNVSPGSGNGHLFVRNAWTGVAISKIATYTDSAYTTAAGSTSLPSNLGKITPWVADQSDNTALRVYAGDMLGYVWRFDHDDNLAPTGREAQLVGQAQTASGGAQPITTKPQVFNISGATGIDAVAIGTGRLLGSPDIGDSTVQSIYVFKDDLSATSLGPLRSASGMVQQTAVQATVNGETVRQVSSAQAVDWSTGRGWFMDFDLTPGERVNSEMLQTGDQLVVAGNAPTTTACTPGGSSWTYVFSLSQGTIQDAFTHDAMVAGFNIIRTTDNALRIIRWDVTGRDLVRSLPTSAAGGSAVTRRTAWREMMD